MVRVLLDLFMERLNSDATPLDAALACHQHCGRSHGQSWQATGNPVYAWHGIRHLHHLCIDASVFVPELKGRHFIGPLPDWCNAWLIEQASKVWNLSMLRHSNAPMPVGEGMAMPDGPLTPQEALGETLSALGFVRGGWNAYERFVAQDYLSLYVFTMDLTKGTRHGAEYSVRKLMDEMGWTDERSARRKIQEIRKVVKPIPLD